MELISVVLPVYNVESYLKESINSILRQSYQNLEIILVDDGSTDESGNICDSYQSLDSRIVVYHKENGGLSDARNYGIEHANGEYIYLVDSDDFLIRSDTLEQLYDGLVANSADIAVAKYIEYVEGDIIQESTSLTIQIMDRERAIASQYNYTNYKLSFVVAWNKLYKKDLFDTITYPCGKLHEDEFTTYKLYLASEKIVYIDIDSYAYRQRSGSIMNSDYSIKKLDALEALEERIKILRDNNISTIETEYYYIVLLSINLYLLKKFGMNEYISELECTFDSLCNKLYTTLSKKRKVKVFILKYFGWFYHKYVKRI